MIRLKGISGIFAVLIALSTANAFAGEWKAFDQKAFQQAQEQGQPVVLDFYAEWCPTCKKQQPILESLLKEPRFQSVVGFKVDYDNSSELKKNLKVQRQSTLVVFKGPKEVSRSVGTTDRKEIEALIQKGL